LPEPMTLRLKYSPGMERADRQKTEEHKENYQYLYNRLHANGVCLIAMQYPLLPLEKLKDLFTKEEIEAGAKDGTLLFAENVDNLQRELKTRPETDIFTDKFAKDFGHTTSLGHSLIAATAEAAVSKMLESGNCTR